MLQGTRGLVFHVSRYSDSSGIIKVFTEESGMQSFVIKSLFSRTAKIKPALFGHLALLDLVVDHKPGRSLQYIREATVNKAFHEITDDIARSSVLLFVNEVLYKAIREEESNLPLFEFIEYSLDSLNNLTIPVQSFHLLFLIRLSEHLGFDPTYSLMTEGEHFDMMSGVPEAIDPMHAFVISGEALRLLKQLSKIDYPSLDQVTAPREVRSELLDKLIDYYRIHLPEMSELKSVKILQEALHG